jgi:hypothetical protein
MQTFVAVALSTWLGLIFLWVITMSITHAGATFAASFAFNSYIIITGIVSIVVGAVFQISAWIEAIREQNPEYLREKKFQQAKNLIESSRQCRIQEDQKWFGRNYFEAERLEMEGKSMLRESAALGYEPAIVLAGSMGLMLW